MTVLNDTDDDGSVRVLFGTSDMSILLVNDLDITDLSLQSLLPGSNEDGCDTERRLSSMLV